MDYKGYTGKILRVDLTSNNFRIEALPIDWIRDYIGGDGFAAKLLYSEVPAKTDPLSVDNKLMIATGPITGTLWPMSGRTVFVSKAAQTGIWGESHVGGHLGAELKYAGYDMLVLEGKAEKPVYVYIEDSHLRLVDATEHWGTQTNEVTAAIKKKHNDPDIHVAAIGPAGENLVKFSAVMINNARAAGRTGMGAVLGSKNVKAVAVRGSKSVNFAEPIALMEQVKKIEQDILAHNEYAKRYQMGTTMLMSDLNSIGILPVNHHLLNEHRC